jgi:site-specific recombinase XerD
MTIQVRAVERKTGQRHHVHEWPTHWVSNIATPPNVSENAHSGYEVDVRVHLILGLGAHWLDRLEAEHLEKLYAKMIRDGKAAGTAHHVHRTIRNALNEAVRRGHIPQNPALLAKAPQLTDEEAEPYTVAEVQRLLKLIAESLAPQACWS